MKSKLLFTLFFFVIIGGCKEERKIEVIPDYDKIYLSSKELDDAPQLIKGDADKLIDTLFKAYLKQYPSFDTMKNRPTMDYKLMIGENGDIEKIFLGKDNDKSLENLVLNTVKNWKFKPGIKNGKNVKSQYPMILWLENQKGINEDDYLTLAESMPGPIGGMKSIQEKIVYPEKAKQKGIQGKVIVQAFIDESGNVVFAKVLDGIGNGCDEVALKAIEQTKFNPGKLKGKPVKVQVTIPIVFRLQ